MYNDLFSIGPLTIHGYGLMIAIGILCAYLVAEKRGKSRGMDPDMIWGLTVCAVVFGLLSAKLLYKVIDACSYDPEDSEEDEAEDARDSAEDAE